MARKGEPDLTSLYGSVFVGGGMIASGMLNFAYGVREARWEHQESKIQARNQHRQAVMTATLPELKAQFKTLLDRLDERRRDVYIGASELAAFEAHLSFEAQYDAYQSVKNGFVLTNLLRDLTLQLRDRIDELDDQAEAEANALLESIED
nr:hypothetical protein [Brucella intermedia]